MSTRSRLLCATALSLAIVACNKSDGAATGDASAAGTAAKSTATNGTFGADSVTVEWTGKFADVDNDKQVPVYKVTNKSAKDVYYLKVWYYFYDGAKKQIGRVFFERYSLSLKPGASQDMPLGKGKDAMVKGDLKSIQPVVVGATYADKGTWDGDVKTLAPDQRPMK